METKYHQDLFYNSKILEEQYNISQTGGLQLLTKKAYRKGR